MAKFNFMLLSAFLTFSAPNISFPAEDVCQGIDPLSAQAFNWPSLSKHLSDDIGKFSTVERFNCLIPQEMRSSFVVMAKSRSLQGPHGRVILIPKAPDEIPSAVDFFSRFEKEQIYLSFTLQNQTKNVNNVEVLRYRPDAPDDSRFELYDLDFNKGLKISEPNPKKCLKCHGLKPRPIWNQENFWPGTFFGFRQNPIRSLDGFLLQSETDPRFYVLNFDKFEAQNLNVELNHAFNMLNAPRLKSKIVKTPDYNAYKFAIVAGFLGCDKGLSFLPEEVRVLHDYTGFLRFDEKRMSEMRSSTSRVYAFEECEGRSNSLMSQFCLDFLWMDDVQRTQLALNSLGNNDTENLEFLRFLFEGRGIGISDWGYDVIEGTYKGLRSSFLNTIFLLAKEDEELYFLLENPEYVGLFYENNPRICEDLKARSLERLQGFQTDTPSFLERKEVSDSNWKHHFTEDYKAGETCVGCHSGLMANYSGPRFSRKSKDYPLAFMICANCHSDLNAPVGPYLPFHDEATMELLLHSPFWRSRLEYRIGKEAMESLDHMPPILILNDKSKQNILAYLSQYE